MGVSGRPRPERAEAPNLRQHGARRELSYLSNTVHVQYERAVTVPCHSSSKNSYRRPTHPVCLSTYTSSLHTCLEFLKAPEMQVWQRVMCWCRSDARKLERFCGPAWTRAMRVQCSSDAFIKGTYRDHRLAHLLAYLTRHATYRPIAAVRYTILTPSLPPSHLCATHSTATHSTARPRQRDSTPLALHAQHSCLLITWVSTEVLVAWSIVMNS